MTLPPLQPDPGSGTSAFERGEFESGRSPPHGIRQVSPRMHLEWLAQIVKRVEAGGAHHVL